MGTRADFYLGRGKDATWLGSIAWDGYPEGIDQLVLRSATKETYLSKLADFVAGRDDWTSPDDGWPWPWTDSRTTDYAYAFDEDVQRVLAYSDGWFDPHDPDADYAADGHEFPDMTAVQNVTFGKRSGIMIFGREAQQ